MIAPIRRGYGDSIDHWTCSRSGIDGIRASGFRTGLSGCKTRYARAWRTRPKYVFAVRPSESEIVDADDRLPLSTVVPAFHRDGGAGAAGDQPEPDREHLSLAGLQHRTAVDAAVERIGQRA